MHSEERRTNVPKLATKVQLWYILRGVYRLLVGKRPLGRARRKWADNFKTGLLEIGWGGVLWIGLAQDTYRWRALVNAVMNLRVP
jgi:hypothetical protein